MKKMVEKFQCPGCVSGNDTDCGSFDYDHDKMRCVGHVLGTHLGFGNKIALGLPKGFHKPGFVDGMAKDKIDVRLWEEGTYQGWDHLNVPVWAMEEEGYLFVRTFSPRINMSWVDVIEGGSLAMCPGAIDVSKFIDEID